VGNIALDIDLARAGEVAGCLAVAEMGLGDDGQPILPGSEHLLGSGMDLHAVLGQGFAGAKQAIGGHDARKTMPGVVNDLHHADVAVVGGRFAGYIAKGRYSYPGTPGRLEDGQVLFGDDLPAVNFQLYRGHNQ